MLGEDQPGWTDTGPQHQWPHGWEYYGYFTVKTDNAAKLAFGTSSFRFPPEFRSAYRAAAGLVNHKGNGHPLWVHHYDCSGDPEFRLIECNCEQLYHEPGCVLPPSNRNPVATQTSVGIANTYGMAPAPTLAPTPTYYQPVSNPYTPAANPMLELTSGFSNLSLDQNAYSVGYRSYPVSQISQSATVYAPNAHQLPVNVTNGVVQTEQRSIHISNLPYSVSEDELKRLINRKVRAVPETVSLHVDHSTGKSKGSGVAGFSTAEEARNAVNVLDKYTLKGKRLRVRPDKNATPIASMRTPTIVDSTARY